MSIVIGENYENASSVPQDKRFWVRRYLGMNAYVFLYPDLTWQGCVWDVIDGKIVTNGLYATRAEAEETLRCWEHLDKLGENKI